jgi:hypothetical protein
LQPTQRPTGAVREECSRSQSVSDKLQASDCREKELRHPSVLLLHSSCTGTLTAAASCFSEALHSLMVRVDSCRSEQRLPFTSFRLSTTEPLRQEFRRTALGRNVEESGSLGFHKGLRQPTHKKQSYRFDICQVCGHLFGLTSCLPQVTKRLSIVRAMTAVKSSRSFHSALIEEDWMSPFLRTRLF